MFWRTSRGDWKHDIVIHKEHKQKYLYILYKYE